MRARGSIRRRAAPRARSAGIALVAALWLTVLLTVIASGFAFSMRGEALAARNALSRAQAEAAADGAVERTVFELSRPRNIAGAWVPDGEPRQWQDGDIVLRATAVDESSKIDLNAAPEPLLRGLLQQVGGLDADAAQHVVEAIADWKDADDLRRPNGAEAPDYKAADRKYVPSNAPFESVGELRRVLGVTPEVYAKVAGSLTVYSRQPGINATTASREVLLAIPGVTPEAVDAYIAQRRNAIEQKLPVPPFPLAQGYLAAPAPVWRIHAEATLPDGVTFVRDAAVRPSMDPRRPLIAFLWQEGARAPATDSKPADTTAGATPDGYGKL
jgi:general secretion pathway protein K